MNRSHAESGLTLFEMLLVMIILGGFISVFGGAQLQAAQAYDDLLKQQERTTLVNISDYLAERGYDSALLVDREAPVFEKGSDPVVPPKLAKTVSLFPFGERTVTAPRFAHTSDNLVSDTLADYNLAGDDCTQAHLADQDVKLCSREDGQALLIRSAGDAGH